MTTHVNAVVIGTGFGGAMTARQLVKAGRSVLLLERGRWAQRDETAWDATALYVHRMYQSDAPYIISQGRRDKSVYPNATVGGNSVFYGAASFRLREADFALRRELDGEVASLFVDWPISYADLAPYYDEAERLLGVVGVAGTDPTEPPRAGGYMAAPPAYGSPARRLAQAARQLDLRPFPLPLAINFHGANGRARCLQCMTCDLYPCKIEAKNDLSVTVLPEAEEGGATIRTQAVATRLVRAGGRVAAVDCLDVGTGETFRVSCDVAVVSGGAISSARLLLASGLGELEPHGALIGRYLMRHCSGVAIGVFPFRTNPEKMFHKQVAITDFYFGHPDGRGPAGPWGMLQALQVPPPEFVHAELGSRFWAWLASLTLGNHVYLLCLAHDVPVRDNRVELDTTHRDPHGQPTARVTYRHHRHDLRARHGLYREAGRILRKAGAVVRLRKPIHTFSHAVGTCRFGTDPDHAVLDPTCRVFGLPNLFVVDGSFMPTSGGVNPSLTIAANGLRVGAHIAREWQSLAGTT